MLDINTKTVEEIEAPPADDVGGVIELGMVGDTKGGPGIQGDGHTGLLWPL